MADPKKIGIVTTFPYLEKYRKELASMGFNNTMEIALKPSPAIAILVLVDASVYDKAVGDIGELMKKMEKYFVANN